MASLLSVTLPSLLSWTGDQTGECRAHGNLGSAFFSKGNYREALTNHRNQLLLAMKLKEREVGGFSRFFGSAEGSVKAYQHVKAVTRALTMQ